MTETAKYQLSESFRKESPKLLSYIRKRISSLEDAEDLLQEVFYQAGRHLNSLNEIENITAWLFRTAQNRIIDRYRKRKETTVSTETEISEDLTLGDLLADDTLNNLSEDDRELAIEAIMEAVYELPEKQREVFIRQEIEGMTFRELAEESGESLNTLIARKRYAVRHLRKRLLHIKELFENY